MKKIEGSYWSDNGGPVVYQCSVWEITNDSEDKKLKELIKEISRRNKGSVTITISLKKEEETEWEQ